MGRATSIIEVAKTAGLSVATVSRVINGQKFNISDSARIAVENAIQELGYEPRPASRRPGPRSRAKLGIIRNTVALLMIGMERASTFGNVFASLLNGVETALKEHDLDMTTAQIDENGRLPAVLLRGHVDGLLLFGKMPREKLRLRLQKHKCVWLLGVFEQNADFWGDHITCDNLAIGQMAAEYLKNCGCRRVAFINGVGIHPDYPKREAAFIREAERLNLQTYSYVTREAVLSFPSFAELEARMVPLVDSLLGNSQRVDGIFCPSDLMTAILHRLLQKKDISVKNFPRIISCNDEQAFLAGLYPRPATIRIGANRIGERGVEQLLYRLRGEGAPGLEKIYIPPVLKPGEMP